MVARQSGGQQHCPNGLPAGATESASRFDGASEMAAKAIVSIDLVVTTCLVFRLIHLLIYPSLAATIFIVQGDRDYGVEDNCGAVRRGAQPGGYYAAYRALDVGGAQAPTEASAAS